MSVAPDPFLWDTAYNAFHYATLAPLRGQYTHCISPTSDTDVTQGNLIRVIVMQSDRDMLAFVCVL